MPVELGWLDIAARLALSVAAGTLFGLDRSEHGRPAGWRTTLLVCVAAALAMILANRLIGTVGKANNSFVQLDMMRLPLGVLTGVGFIGAGAIIRRDDIVYGVTTAATLWIASVIGLCFGAGQLLLGVAGTAIGVAALTGLRFAERMLPQHRHAQLRLTVAGAAPINDGDIRIRLQAAGFRASMPHVVYDEAEDRRDWCWEVHWLAHRTDPPFPEIVGLLARLDGVLALSWQPEWRP
ncbi:MAG TPA: MgtC/SapB family protein [Stellaceae bacterium]|nr:MgtC/SapB family protein [Stellaceae bacterium]